MAKQKITDLIASVLQPYLEANGYELFHVEFVKESKDWFLRVYIEKTEDGEYVAISTDDCETVSRFLSSKLDELDPIEQNYFLEVSSPGMDRPLISEKDFLRFRGQLIDINLYKAINGSRSISGVLVGLADGQIIIRNERDEEIGIPMNQASKTKLAIIF